MPMRQVTDISGYPLSPALMRRVVTYLNYTRLFIALALHLLVSVTNFRMLNIDWRHYWLLFGGIMFSLSWFRAQQTSTGSAVESSKAPGCQDLAQERR